MSWNFFKEYSHIMNSNKNREIMKVSDSINIKKEIIVTNTIEGIIPQ